MNSMRIEKEDWQKCGVGKHEACLFDGGMYPEEIARAFLYDVYCPVSLCVLLDDARRVLDVHQFDTAYFTGEICPDIVRASEVWLLTNHHDGSLDLTNADLQNRGRIALANPNARLRVFLAGEDIGCREIQAERKEEIG